MRSISQLDLWPETVRIVDDSHSTQLDSLCSILYVYVYSIYLVESTIYVGLAGFPRSLNSVKRSEEMSLTAKRPSHSLSTPLMCVDECVCVIEPLRDCFDAHLEVVFGFIFISQSQ